MAWNPIRTDKSQPIGVRSTWTQRLCLCLLLGAGCAAADRGPKPGTAPTEAAKAPATQPFFNARAHQTEYVGPGREIPPPEDIEEVRIGYFGPTDPQHPTAGAMWLAATLAVEEANQAGGYDGRPFRLITSWSENPWGTGIKGVTRLVYTDKVWAIVGAPDGPSAHLVEQVVAKARLAFVNPVSTDKTTNLANVPWIFSCAPGDHLVAPVLADAIVSRTDGQGIALVAATDHDSRQFTTELLASLHRLKAFPTLRLDLRPGSTDLDLPLQRLRGSEPAVVALIAGPADSARFVSAWRDEGLVQPVFGGPSMGHRLFAKLAGESADGVVFPLLWHAGIDGKRSGGFARRLAERFGVEPDYTAAYTYDATSLLIAAVRQAGLNRAEIRDCVRELSPWLGVSGTITWDPAGHNSRAVGLGTVQDGRVTPLK